MAAATFSVQHQIKTLQMKEIGDHCGNSVRVAVIHAGPGAGKGTLAGNLRQLFENEIRVVSASEVIGELCRADGNLANTPAVNKKLEEALGGLNLFEKVSVGGKLVPAVARLPKMVFVEGWPRDEAQAEFCAELFAKHSLLQEVLVLHWQVENSLSIARQMGRWANMLSGQAVLRTDHTEDADAANRLAHHRLGIFREEEPKIIAACNRHGMRSVQFDGHGTPEKNLRDFLKITGWPFDERSIIQLFENQSALSETERPSKEKKGSPAKMCASAAA